MPDGGRGTGSSVDKECTRHPSTKEQLNCPGHSFRDFIGPNRKALQRIWTEGGGNGDIGRVASARDEHSTNPRHIVPRIERMPGSAEIDFDPRREIHHSVWWLGPHVSQVSGAVTRRNIHAAAESDGQMREVAADAHTLVKRLPSRSRRARSLIIESNMIMNKITDRLHS